MNMIRLKKTFKNRSVYYTQLYRDDDVIIYETSLHSIEVFKLRVKHSDMYHDDDYEHYPSNEDFGKFAWCATSMSQLKRILDNHFAHITNKHEICKNVSRNLTFKLHE